MAGAVFPFICKPVAASLLALASTEDVKKSDVDLVEKGVCIESGRQHLGHVVEGRDCERCKG